MCASAVIERVRATHTRQANVIAHESSRLSIENIVATLSVERGATAQCVGITVSLLFIKFYIFPRSLLCVARSRTHTHTRRECRSKYAERENRLCCASAAKYFGHHEIPAATCTTGICVRCFCRKCIGARAAATSEITK